MRNENGRPLNGNGGEPTRKIKEWGKRADERAGGRGNFVRLNSRAQVQKLLH